MADPTYSQHVEQLAAKLHSASMDMKRDARYYDATYRPESVGVAVPEPMRCLTAAIGWPRMYLDSIEERLDIEGFRIGENQGSLEQLTEWWQANDLDEESGLAHLDALIYGRSYITVAAPGEDDDPNIPLIRVESPLDMYAETDPRTRKVTRAIRIYNDPYDEHTERWATLYLPNETVPLRMQGGHWVIDTEIGIRQHNLGEVPVVPLLNRERLSERDGKSEITPELRSFTDAASRIMMDMQAAAELMAVPQRVLFGVDPETLAPSGSPAEVLNSYLAQILAVENESGKAHQFQAAELINFVNVLQELAKHVAAYTGLPPQYLSFSSENPASAEAIKSSETRLVKKCERKARLFGGSWEQVMRLAMRVMGQEVPAEMNRLEIVWRDPSTPTYAAKADAAVKLYGNGQGVIPKEQARIDMGYTQEQREAMREWDDQEERDSLRLAETMARMQARTAAQNQQQGEQQSDQRPQQARSSER